MRGGNSTWPQIAPSAIRNVPFITPSRCAESAIRIFVKRRSFTPVTNPIKNKNMPCHINPRSAVRIRVVLPLDPVTATAVRSAPGPYIIMDALVHPMSLDVATGFCVDPVGVSSREDGGVLAGRQGAIADHRTE